MGRGKARGARLEARGGFGGGADPGQKPYAGAMANSTRAVAYTVRISLADEATREVYIRWLAEDHLAKVLVGGAARAEVVAMDPIEGSGADAGRVVVEVRYQFRDRAGLERYLQEHAPRLRAEGLAKFADIDLRITRSIGLIAYREPEGYSDVRRGR
jgi:hypothetical protein